MKLFKFNTLLIIVSLFIFSYSKEITINPLEFIQIQSESTGSINKAGTSKNMNNQAKYSLELKSNKLISPNLIKKNSTYVKCDKKTGGLQFVYKHPQKGQTKIQAIPVFASLNKHTFSLFKGIFSELFESIKLDSIQRITQHYYGTFCFNIIIAQASNAELNINPVTVCATSKEEMNNWINSVLEFKHCKLNKINRRPAKVIVDFDNVNKAMINQRKAPLRGLYYNNTNQTAIEPKQNVVKSKKINNKVKIIINTIEKAKSAHEKIKRKLEKKLNTAKKVTDHILKKRQRIREILRKNVIIQKQKKMNLLKLRKESKEMRILKEAAEKIKKLNQRQIEKSKAEYYERIKAEKERSKRITRNMIKIIIDKEKLRDYSKCISYNLYSKLEFI
jgi:hypothetical protein